MIKKFINWYICKKKDFISYENFCISKMSKEFYNFIYTSGYQYYLQYRAELDSIEKGDKILIKINCGTFGDKYKDYWIINISKDHTKFKIKWYDNGEWFNKWIEFGKGTEFVEILKKGNKNGG